MGGTLDNFIVINPGDECLELDGPEGIMVAKHFLKNGSIYAGNAQGLVDLDPNSNVDIDSVYFFGLKSDRTSTNCQLITHAHLQILKQPCRLALSLLISSRMEVMHL